MDILIRGMEMPKKQVCVILNPNGLVEVLDANNVLLEEYQAIPVTPHERLIEDVAVREQIDEWLDSVGDVVVGRGLSYYGELLGCIEDAPTITPASEEGEI